MISRFNLDQKRLNFYENPEIFQKEFKNIVSSNNENEFLKDYYSEVKAKRKKDEITLPSSIKKELSINPFLRLTDKNIISNASNFASINLSLIHI